MAVVATNPVLETLLAAARGEFPPADGRVEFVPPPPGLTQGVVAFTAHHVIAADVDPEEARARLDPDDLGAPVKGPFVAWLASRLDMDIGPYDNVLIAPDPPSVSAEVELIERPDLLDDPMLARSKRVREDLRLYSDRDRRSIVLVARGFARRWEFGLVVDEEHRHAGLGRQLIAAAPSLVPAGEPVFAQVTPGNARSLRAFIAAGWRPIGGEVLFLPRS